MRHPLRLIALTVVALVSAACVSRGDAITEERALNARAVKLAPPSDAVVIAERGAVRQVASLAEAWKSAPTGLQRFVYRVGEEGDLEQRMVYLPADGAVAGPLLATALGLRVTSADGHTFRIGHDLRGVETGEGATLSMDVAAPDGGRSIAVSVAYDPDFDGTLVVPTAVAEALRLHAYEIPGDVDVHVALGRPFGGRRTRARVSIAALDVSEIVELVIPRQGVR